MADTRWEVKIWQSDGTVFSSANESGAAVRLRSSTTAGADSGEYTGNVAVSGAFSEVTTGNGLWYIQIDSGDSGWYLVESQTTATGAWESVNGFAPIYITREEFLPLTGGTMSGNIVMGDNDITGVSDITFTSGAVGTINSIVANNLIDRAAPGTISGTLTQTGFIDITASKLKIGGTIVTSTAADVDMLSGRYATGDAFLSLQNQLGLNTPGSAYAVAHTITLAQVGHVTIDSSGSGFQMVLPLINETSSGIECMIYTNVGGNDCTVIDNAANGGFVMPLTATTEAPGNTLTFGATAGEFVCVKSNGGAGVLGLWMIIGAKGIALS